MDFLSQNSQLWSVQHFKLSMKLGQSIRYDRNNQLEYDEMFEHGRKTDEVEMSDVEAFYEMALSFPEATEEPHFHKVSFRVRKKILATLDLDKGTAVLKLTEQDQTTFTEMNDTVIYPVKGALGKQGWTMVELENVPCEVIKSALTCAFRTVAPKKLTDKLDS